MIKQGLNINEQIQTIRIIQGNNDYSVTGTASDAAFTEYVPVIFSNITVITDNNEGGGGNGIYNINDPITVRFSLPPNLILI